MAGYLEYRSGTGWHRKSRRLYLRSVTRQDIPAILCAALCAKTEGGQGQVMVRIFDGNGFVEYRGISWSLILFCMQQPQEQISPLLLSLDWENYPDAAFGTFADLHQILLNTEARGRQNAWMF